MKPLISSSCLAWMQRAKRSSHSHGYLNRCTLWLPLPADIDGALLRLAVVGAARATPNRYPMLGRGRLSRRRDLLHSQQGPRERRGTRTRGMRIS